MKPFRIDVSLATLRISEKMQSKMKKSRGEKGRIVQIVDIPQSKFLMKSQHYQVFVQ